PPIFLLILSLLFVAGALLWLSPVTALILLRRGRFKLAVSVATIGLLLAHSIATFILGVTNGAVLVVFQIPIALAGLLAGRRLLLTVAGWSIALIIVVTILESFSPPLSVFFAALPSPDGSVPSPLTGQPVGLDVGFFIAVTVLL